MTEFLYGISSDSSTAHTFSGADPSKFEAFDNFLRVKFAINGIDFPDSPEEPFCEVKTKDYVTRPVERVLITAATLTAENIDDGLKIGDNPLTGKNLNSWKSDCKKAITKKSWAVGFLWSILEGTAQERAAPGYAKIDWRAMYWPLQQYYGAKTSTVFLAHEVTILDFLKTKPNGKKPLDIFDKFRSLHT